MSILDSFLLTMLMLISQLFLICLGLCLISGILGNDETILNYSGNDSDSDNISESESGSNDGDPASIWTLSYDGIVSPKLINAYERNDDPDVNKHGPVPYAMVIELSTKIGTDIVKMIAVQKKKKDNDEIEEMTEEERTLDLDRRCFKPLIGGGKCDIDHYREGQDILQASMLYQEEPDGSITFRLDASLSTTNTFLTRDVLVRSIPKINQHIMYYHNVVWTIRQRPTVSSMKQTWSPSSNSIAASQMRRDRMQTSVEHLILHRSDFQNRMRIDSANILYGPALPLELWHYQLPEHRHAVRSLFIDGHLQSTTLPAGAAHAEALVHPAMISVLNPTNILIVSLEPTTILREVLKYNAVSSVTLLGYDMGAVEMTMRHMSILDDCSFLDVKETSCLLQEIVNHVDRDIEEWLAEENQAMLEFGDEYIPFDAIFVDVPPNNYRWLSKDFQLYLGVIIHQESIVVISAGSAPPIFDLHEDDLDFSPRDLLLKEAHRTVDDGGLQYSQIYQYDEPLAKPMASTFIAMLPHDSSTGGDFVRENVAAIEIDMITKMHSGIGTTPTRIYDGQTHKSYQTLSRTWQEWYCNTFPGRELPLCYEFFSRWYDISLHHYDNDFEVQKDPTFGRSLVATNDIPSGHFVLSEDSAMSLQIDAQLWEALEKFIETHPESEYYIKLKELFIVYGFETQIHGSTGWSVSIASNSTFMNHGCTDWAINVQALEHIFHNEDGGDVGFSPPLHRFAPVINHLAISTRDIEAGEHVMMNYSVFREEPTQEFKDILKSMCSDGVGYLDTRSATVTADTDAKITTSTPEKEDARDEL